MITQEIVQQLFEYKDGFLLWKTSNSKKIKVGDIAGCKNPKGYVRIGINGKYFFAHRLIYLLHKGHTAKWIDHIDRNPSNNKIENLREATPTQNKINSKKRCDNSSGVTGVSWDKRTSKWQVFIKINTKRKYLGRFKELDDAKNVYQQAAKKYFGEFANI